MKKYRVTLTGEERQDLLDLIASGKGAAKKLAHARGRPHGASGLQAAGHVPDVARPVPAGRWPGRARGPSSSPPR